MRTTLFLLFLAAAPLIACTPSPEKVCGHLIDVMEKDGKKLSDDKRKDEIADCVKDVTKVKEGDPSGWSDCAKCAMNADTMKAFGDCDKVCKKP
jgi:hypothetical protein